jgi:hypothetical protein
MAEGIQVHGLKEKIAYLENILLNMKKQQLKEESKKAAAPP